MDQNENDDNFMKIFKYYKSNKPKPSMENVLSVEDKNHVEKVVPLIGNSLSDNRTEFLGLKNFQSWQLYSFPGHPGLFLIRNPFTGIGQRYWIRKCLEEYPRKPNITNIDIEVVIDDWWRECYIDGTCNRQLLKKLRWTTLGYHHNWDTKVYSDNNRTTFPEDLAELSDVVASYLEYSGYKAEAAIVNYYHMKSTLSAHTDHSEVNLQAPLFSFSFGQSAIFLLGGQEKSTVPSAILVQSGDILIMSQQARVCYHAVPKILPAKSSPWDYDSKVLIDNEMPTFKYIKSPKNLISSLNCNTDDKIWSKYRDYVRESRINMNVRQVLNENQTNLADPVFIDK
ncbi:nucleic acid dioxygenase ALKBH1 [Ostrinia furnacalis]|uniref:nucleic acid dioxygenase ALKBH1 n=1 Tax=Ostrinia furnacalis TaxID=93504 RepID=UPI0010390E24|nr:nucleic acid dioxygenase ALKBH1 [Ostrinia furnacalis]